MPESFPDVVPVLESGQVRLRAHRTDDVPAIVEQCTDPESVRWTTVPRPYSEDDARGWIEMVADGWNTPDSHRYWAIEWTDDSGVPRFGGTVDLRPRGQGGAEIGFGLHPDARGLHVMSTAVRLVCRWWFDQGGQRVTWWANAGNLASWRVAWACGFTWHGEVPEYLPHPDGLVDAWLASLGRDDDPTRPVAPWTHSPGAPVVGEFEDTRSDGPMTGAEREVLDHWLDLYRESVLLKIAGLDAEQLCRRAVPPSTMSLVGIVRHLTEVEAYWVREVLLGDPDVPDYYCTRESPDGDFDDTTIAAVEHDVAAYREEVERTRALAAEWTDLDVPGRGLRRGNQVNLRWILTHLIEEYARHLGHMDLLREAIDGRTGY